MGKVKQQKYLRMPSVRCFILESTTTSLEAPEKATGTFKIHSFLKYYKISYRKVTSIKPSSMRPHPTPVKLKKKTTTLV